MKKLISAFLIVSVLLSVICVSVAADEGRIIIDEKFTSEESFLQNFMAGAFFIDSGILIGYKEARTFQGTGFETDDVGCIIPGSTAWQTYDCEATIAISEDEFGDVEDRHIALSYCNDNLLNQGLAEGRVFYNFNYSVPTGEFTLTAGGVGVIGDEFLIATPVPYEICTDGSEFFTLGMSIGKDRIRCYYNDVLIFDFIDTAKEHFIADYAASPFLLWNTNNCVMCNSCIIATEGYLYPYADAPVTEATEATEAPVTEESETTTRIDTEIVTNDDGETEIVTQIVTEAPVVDDNDAGNAGGNNGGDAADTVNTTANAGPSTTTGDMTFAVVAAMVAALGSALIVKKVRG